VVLKQLDDDFDVVMVVLDGDDAQNVGSVLSIWVFAVLVSQHQARVGLFDLTTDNTQTIKAHRTIAMYLRPHSTTIILVQKFLTDSQLV